MTADLLLIVDRLQAAGLTGTTDVPAGDEALYARVVDHLGIRIPRRSAAQGRQ